MTKKSFMKGAAILGIAGIISKFIGFVYRIGLVSVIGTEGTGIMAPSFYIYNMLLGISTYGVNIAIAKLISERRAVGDYNGAKHVFNLSLKMVTTVAIFMSVGIALFARPIISMMATEYSYYSLIALVPALFIVPIMSAFRGLFQGMNDMRPTAISQIVEQFIRVIVGFLLASYLINKGLPISVGGASFGASAGAIGGVLVVIYFYFKTRSKFDLEVKQTANKKIETNKDILKSIIKMAAPLALGAMLIPFMNSVDSMIITKSAVEIGKNKDYANAFIGSQSMAQTIINFVLVFSTSIATSIVPALSSYNASKKMKEFSTTAISALRMTLIIALPCGIGIASISEPIIKMIYRTISPYWVVMTGKVTFIMGIGFVFTSMHIAISAVLQSIGKPDVPIKNFGIGVAIKIGLSYLMIRSDLGMIGITISTAVIYLFIMILDIISLRKHANVKFSFSKYMLRPIVSASVMGICAKYTYDFVGVYLGNITSIMISISIAAVIYLFMLLISKSIQEEDFKMLPKGEKIHKVLKKLRVV